MNLRVKKGSRIEVVLPDGLSVTWEAVSDTDTSNVIDVIARLETMPDHADGILSHLGGGAPEQEATSNGQHGASPASHPSGLPVHTNGSTT